MRKEREKERETVRERERGKAQSRCVLMPWKDIAKRHKHACNISNLLSLWPPQKRGSG